MTDPHRLQSERIEKAAESLREVFPEYDALLSFYENLFIAQETARLQLNLDPIATAPAVFNLRHKNRMPLIDLREFVFDTAAGRRLMTNICRILRDSESEMVSSAAALEIAVTGAGVDIETLFSSLLSGNDSYFQSTAERLQCDKHALLFITYNSLKPALLNGAETLSVYLSDPAGWKKGICPICGQLPAIGVMDFEGHRAMACSFCWQEWPLPRLFCPFCSNTDSRTLNYLCSETEPSYRLDCCEKCRKYIKIVDMRTASHAVYLPLEQVASLHLDIKARQSGYESGIFIPLPDT
jgi:FdhE protein